MREIPFGIAREPGTPIDTVLLQREPMWSYVSFFKDMDSYTQLTGGGKYGLMNFPAIPEKYNICEASGPEHFRVARR